MNINEKFRLASGYYQKGDLKQAENICKTILEEQPNNFHVLYFTGIIYYQLGDYDSSVGYIKKAIQLNPNHAEAHYNLGNALREKGQFDEAISCYRKAFETNPAFYEAYHNLGIVLQNRKQLDEAIIYYQKALEINPGLEDAHYNLGTIFQDKEQLDEAIVHYEKALRINHNFTDVYYNLGNIYRETRHLDEAIACFQKALQLNPGLEDAYHNLGIVFQEKGMYDEALSYFQKALQLNPNLIDARWSISLIHLAYGNFSQGWKEYECRWYLKDAPRRNFYQPLWDGTSLKGKTLLVYDEQGVGDEIMFASCLPEIVAGASLCVIETDKRLVPLFARSFPDAKVIERIKEGAAYPPELKAANMRVPIGSLPKFLRPNLASFSKQKAYLVPDAFKTEAWHNRFKSLGKGFRVGISWRGGKRKDVRLTRSTVLEQWARLFSISGINFINLQYGDCKEELEDTKAKLGVSIHDWEDADPLKDLDNFASQIAALDLVVSVDNATVHMAGALGIPVWTLLPFACDWRWMQKFEDTPWYPSMRLFRQNSFGDWDGVFERVYNALKEAVRNGCAAPAHWRSSLENSYTSLLHNESSKSDENIPSENQRESAIINNLTGLSEKIREKEREKYLAAWSVDNRAYSNYSPGFELSENMKFLDFFKSEKVTTILDAGIGSGKLCKKMLSMGFECYGLDIAENCLDADLLHLKDKILTVGTLWDSALFEANHFDAIVCTDVMEHVPTDYIGKVFDNFYRWTKKFLLLQIALFDDYFGTRIGQPLHLTVRPKSWWDEQLSNFKILTDFVLKDEHDKDVYAIYLTEKSPIGPRL